LGNYLLHYWGGEKESFRGEAYEGGLGGKKDNQGKMGRGVKPPP